MISRETREIHTSSHGLRDAHYLEDSASGRDGGVGLDVLVQNYRSEARSGVSGIKVMLY